jgi:ketosteroid isomerase-like protein
MLGGMQTHTAALADTVLDRAEIELIIRGFCSSVIQSPTEALERFCASDISLCLLENPVAPGAPGYFRGREAAVFAIQTILVNLEVLSFEFDDLIIDGHEAALRWRIHVQHRATGVTGDLSVFDHVVISDGLIARYSSFFDTDAFGQLMAGERQSVQARASNRQPVVLPDLQTPGLLAGSSQPDMFARNRREHFIRDYWADRLKRGSAAIGSYFAEDCEMHFVGDPSLISFARLHKGIEETRALVDATNREFEILHFRIAHILVDGCRAALHWKAAVRHRGTSARGTMESYDYITFRDDRIFSVTKFFDSARALNWIRG